MLRYKIENVSLCSNPFVGINRIKFYYNNDILSCKLTKESIEDLLLAFPLSICIDEGIEFISKELSIKGHKISDNDKEVITELFISISKKEKSA